MEILFEILGEVAEAVFDWIISSPKVPRIVRAIAVSVLCMPIIALFLWLGFGCLRDGRLLVTAFCGLLAVLMSGVEMVLLARIFRR